MLDGHGNRLLPPVTAARQRCPSACSQAVNHDRTGAESSSDCIKTVCCAVHSDYWYMATLSNCSGMVAMLGVQGCKDNESGYEGTYPFLFLLKLFVSLHT
jgi:hypothetical protein